LARWLHARDVFEIGTYNGLTARYLASNVEQASIRTLDLPAGAAPALSLDSGDGLHLGVALAEPALDAERVLFLRGDSAVFDFRPFEGSCDLVYVDGAHSFEYVLSDSERALRMLRERGAIVWDDYRRGMAGVVRALDLLSTREALYRVPGTRLAVYLTSAARAQLEASDG
jgi:predicted O-methyltransferase YrrM